MLYLTRAQVREVDRRSIEEYGIPGVVLMENASRGVARVAMERFGLAAGARVMILCGGGNNGGDGLAAGRQLHNFGLEILIGLYGDAAKYQGDALVNWRVVQAMKLQTFEATPEAIAGQSCDLVIDAIFGTGLARRPREPFGEVVEAVAALRRPVLAVDLPSGLDCDTGQPLGACVRADHTVTFVARKAGFANVRSREFTGEVTVVDIGCPRELALLV